MTTPPSTHPSTLAVADFTGCRALGRLTPGEATTAFLSALTAAGATIVETVSHRYPGQGLTSVAILQESHAVLHTWPETGTMHVDIFMCSGSLDARRVFAELGALVDAGHIDIRDVPRAAGQPVSGC